MSRPNTQVWIASHISNEFRADVLKDALRSLANQSIPPNKVCISFSLGDVIQSVQSTSLESTPESLESTKQTIRSAFKDSAIELQILDSSVRLRQFEHLERLWDARSSDAEFILFMDDDDLCTPDRIEKFLEAHSEHPDTKVFYSGRATFEHCENSEHIEQFIDVLIKKACVKDSRDHGPAIVHIDCLSRFFRGDARVVFDADAHDILMEGPTDMLFMIWAQHRYDHVIIPGIQYLQRLAPDIEYPEGKYTPRRSDSKVLKTYTLSEPASA